jgi:hypothetical protein
MLVKGAIRTSARGETPAVCVGKQALAWDGVRTLASECSSETADDPGAEGRACER